MKTPMHKFAMNSTETQRPATLYVRKRAALGAMNTSLLHQAFTGEHYYYAL